MNKRIIHINASRQYDVIISRGILTRSGEATAKVHKPCRAMIVSDDNVWPLYGETVKSSFESAGFATEHFVFAHGETSKNIHTLSELLEALACARLTRSDLVIALGGGVVGDLAGFAAASYLRGIDFVQIPTTLLAMVDSSVGGKTAIDLAAGKNLAGAFHQPCLVLCDCETLKTLPREFFLDGVAETLKHGMICDAALFERLERDGLDVSHEDLDDVVARSIEIKGETVAADEFDRGRRNLLNFGHTLGHSIEKLSGYTTSHGHAVAVGMAIVTRAAAQSGMCPAEDAQRLDAALSACRLPTSCEYSAKQLADGAQSDKKRSGDTISLIVPKEIGRCEIEAISVHDLYPFARLGMGER